MTRIDATTRYMRYVSLFFVLPVLPAGGTSLAAQTAVPVANAAETITAADVARHIGVIAADSMLGRNTPSPGLEKTAQYIADQFQRLGLVPGGDHGTWFQRYPLPGDSTRTAPNTIGLLGGSDPKLKDEYLVVSAHMDHIGSGQGHGPAMQPPEAEDSIYNGAYDNAAGVAGLIELAAAFGQSGARPRRSVLFVAVSGQEHGLWGSTYFVEHPTVPLPRIVADLNLDRAGSEDGVAVVGHGYSSLGATLDSILAAHPELKLDTVHVWTPGQLFDMDQVSFAQHGIPGLSFTGGREPPFNHELTDTPEKVDADRIARVLRLVFYLGRAVGAADPRPTWHQAWYQQITERP